MLFLVLVSFTFQNSGEKTTMMSTRNFYNAMTPGSHLGEEVIFETNFHTNYYSHDQQESPMSNTFSIFHLIIICQLGEEAMDIISTM